MKPIRKAVLLGAGRGTRLGVLTSDRPKPMLEVAGRPIIAHILHGLAAAGIDEVIVVTGYRGEQIEQFCARLTDEGSKPAITTVRQPSLNGTGGAVLAAMPAMEGEERFLCGWADVLIDRESYAQFVNAARSTDYDLLLAVNWMDDPHRGAAVYVDSAMRVRRIVEKPPPGTSATHWNNAGLCAATARLFDYVRRLAPSTRGEIELPAALAAMIDDGLVVRAVELRGFWSDVGTPEDLARARDQFARQ